MPEPPPYSIRLLETDEEAHCSDCGAPFRTVGLIGHRGDQPLCDACLLAGSEQLGVALALLIAVRTFAVVGRTGERKWQEALEDLGTFASIYELVASRVAPPRGFHFPDVKSDLIKAR